MQLFINPKQQKVNQKALRTATISLYRGPSDSGTPVSAADFAHGISSSFSPPSSSKRTHGIHPQSQETLPVPAIEHDARMSHCLPCYLLSVYIIPRPSTSNRQGSELIRPCIAFAVYVLCPYSLDQSKHSCIDSKAPIRNAASLPPQACIHMHQPQIRH